MLQQSLRRAFGAQAIRWQGTSPVWAALCEGVAAGPAPTMDELFSRFLRIISATAPNVPLLLAALHALALEGAAPRSARFFPSCGGAFAPAEASALLDAAEADLAEAREDALDFMLSQEPADPALEICPLVLLGALAAAERFGGGLSVVELGSGGGLRLLFDRYAYRFGSRQLGESALSFSVEAGGATVAALLTRGMPRVVARCGLDLAPADLTDPRELNAVAAFLPPDQVERLERLRQAAAIMAQQGRPDLRQGDVTSVLAPLLVEAYNEMAPGNTLLLVEALHWSGLSEEEKKRAAQAVQTLAAQVQPHKPIAWVQADTFTPGSCALELRLHTFGWADPEDRAVRRLAEASPAVTRVRWLE